MTHNLDYSNLRKKIGKFHSSNYDISNICNLSCKGCLYFSTQTKILEKEKLNDINKWEVFFEKEKSRGINFVYLAGAEPSLVPKRIEASYKYIKNGIIFTNGIKKISKDIKYKIHISLWGDNENTSYYRGDNINEIALKNYKDDARAIAVMTINAQNIQQIKNVSELCNKYNIKLTFSYFSPTTYYLEEELNLKEKDFKIAHEEIKKYMNIYPHTIIYSLKFDHWLNNKNGLYQLDSEGIAIDCGNRLTKKFKHFDVNRESKNMKCCSPNLDCKNCKAYAMAYATYLHRFKKQNKEDWLEIWDIWQKLFLNDLPNNT